MTDNLKPCPFCGYSKKIHERRLGTQRTQSSWEKFSPRHVEISGTAYLECQNCYTTISAPADFGCASNLEDFWNMFSEGQEER